MSTTEVSGNTEREGRVGKADLKLEAVVIPVSDVDRAKQFYAGIGWRLDADIRHGDAFRIVQFTPPGSRCSAQFGNGLTSAAPGSAENLLAVSDIDAARAELVRDGIDVSGVFHDGTGPGRFDPAARASGRDPQGRTYFSYAEFRDPDGNLWQLQEITSRLPGRVDPTTTTFDSTADLANAMRRASVAHGEHEQRIGHADEDWPDWYAAYMVAEAGGTELPT